MPESPRSPPPATPERLAAASARLRALETQINRAVLGQRQVIRELIVAMVAAGHVLLEGLPGVGKTLLVRAMAQAIGGHYSRIQFTPDLMPSDVTGHAIFDMQTEQFHIRRGPVFCNLLLGDEINRAPAKTQAAMLEAMQERQVTIEGKPLPLEPPFLVMATQNPIEQEGTYPLPQAQLDRFLIKGLDRLSGQGRRTGPGAPDYRTVRWATGLTCRVCNASSNPMRYWRFRPSPLA